MTHTDNVPPAAPAEPNPPLNLLIVDDEPDTRTLLTGIFTMLGYKVRAATDGFDALAAMRDGVPDILLSDLNMPRMSGFELLSIVRRRFPAVRVVAMSGAYSGTLVPQAIAADAFYEKASIAEALYKMVATVGHAELQTQRLSRATVPMWVQSVGPGTAGHVFVMLACQDCMRTFCQAVEETGGFIKTTYCHHCAAPLHYAVVEANGVPHLYPSAPKKTVMEIARDLLANAGAIASAPQ